MRIKQPISFTRDAVYFYHKRIEVDFYVLEAQLAIQVCYSLNDIGTRKRETTELLQLSKRIEVKRMLIITMDEESIIVETDIKIEVVSIWKWLLGIAP